MGYGARARVQVGIRTEVEPVWIHTPSLAPVSLPFTMLGPLPCAHLAQNPPSRCDSNAVFYPDLRHGDARRYDAHDATLRYAHAVATCGAAAALQLGAFGHSVCSSSPPGAVAVDACCAFHAAHRALRALSVMRLRSRFPRRSISSDIQKGPLRHTHTDASCSETAG